MEITHNDKTITVNSKESFRSELLCLLGKSVTLSFKKRYLFVDVAKDKEGHLTLKDSFSKSEISLAALERMTH